MLKIIFYAVFETLASKTKNLYSFKGWHRSLNDRIIKKTQFILIFSRITIGKNDTKIKNIIKFI